MMGNMALEACVAEGVTNRVLGTIPAKSEGNLCVRHSTTGFRGNNKGDQLLDLFGIKMARPTRALLWRDIWSTASICDLVQSKPKLCNNLLIRKASIAEGLDLKPLVAGKIRAL